MAALVNYFEVGSADPDAARSFCGSLFDWTFGEPSPAGYRMVNGDSGGPWDTTSLGGNVWAIFYVQVDDVKAAIARAESLGASVTIPFVDNGVEDQRRSDVPGVRAEVWMACGVEEDFLPLMAQVVRDRTCDFQAGRCVSEK